MNTIPNPWTLSLALVALFVLKNLYRMIKLYWQGMFLQFIVISIQENVMSAMEKSHGLQKTLFLITIEFIMQKVSRR